MSMREHRIEKILYELKQEKYVSAHRIREKILLHFDLADLAEIFLIIKSRIVINLE